MILLAVIEAQPLDQLGTLPVVVEGRETTRRRGRETTRVY